MKKSKYLLDSDILIDHLKSVKAAGSFLESQEEQCSISVITRAEVLVGGRDGRFDAMAAFLDCFHTLGIDKEIADKAALLRQQYHWKLPDAFQAALAQVHSLIFITRNIKDFPPERHSFVKVPYRL
ncbi:MAG TPA: PIN domain-containing protein [bacterium]|jgi:predicted nucleic acid-binding protein|nr:PIN domain-containing protein [bacterium]